MNKFLVSKRDVLSNVAKWAVAQSPYHRPDNLEIVLDKLNEVLGKWTDDLGYKSLTYNEIKELLKENLFKIPEFTLWNERKNGNQCEYQFISRYSSDVDPDNDFIDLDALIRNVANEIVRNDFQIPIPEIIKCEV